MRCCALFSIVVGLLGCGGSGDRRGPVDGGAADASGEDGGTGADGGCGAACACEAGGLCPTAPFGEPLHYRGIWGAADDAIWIVGDRGAVRFYDGAAWSPQESGVEVTLNAVHGTGPDDVWAVGDGGTILHFDGTAWSPVGSGTTDDLLDVSAYAPDGAWAVGGTDIRAVAVRWDGASWSEQTPDTDRPLVAVHARSAARVVAVDGLGLFEWNGTAWARLETTSNPRDVHALETVTLLLRGGLGGFELHDRSTAGVEGTVAIGGRAGGDVSAYAFMAREDGAFVVNGPNGLVHRWDGATEHVDYHTVHALRSSWLASDGTAWAAGDYGTVVRADATGARTIDAGDQHTMLGVHVRAPDDVWMVGLAGRVTRFDGAAWATLDSGTEVDLYAVAAAADGSMWAVGDEGVVVRFEGTTATRHDVDDTGRALRAVAADEGAAVWVAGAGAFRWDGSTWTAAAPALSNFINDAWSPEPGELWLVRTNGGVERYVDGVDQALAEPSTGNDIWTIWGSSATDVWVGGYANDMHHWDGSAWTEEAVPVSGTPGAWQAIFGTGPDDVYAAGSYVIHYDGTGWTEPVNLMRLTDIHGAGGALWAVGWNASFLHRAAP